MRRALFGQHSRLLIPCVMQDSRPYDFEMWLVYSRSFHLIRNHDLICCDTDIQTSRPQSFCWQNRDELWLMTRTHTTNDIWVNLLQQIHGMGKTSKSDWMRLVWPRHRRRSEWKIRAGGRLVKHACVESSSGLQSKYLASDILFRSFGRENVFILLSSGHINIVRTNAFSSHWSATFLLLTKSNCRHPFVGRKRSNCKTTSHATHILAAERAINK